ncbi:Mediator of RNA polymerase II transcription subunit 1 [Chelonia mydas]|uniref:Mediator of RNA polymerase II transcription subunit 1 n=1 Tax=Chelonia mydas TaxID=8469 RepID=M7BXJ8_CHEMY|nr:Mediator of RNA polymerase II transcription subunit 1 [Chelonia mydas]
MLACYNTVPGLVHAPKAADYPVKLISTNALMDKLHLKYAQKPWIETLKLVRLCMDKPPRGSIHVTPHHPLLSCLEKIQRTLNAKSLSTVMTRLEFLSKQMGLKSHISPNGTVCYLTSDMFYVEVQLEKDGKVIDVKLAHLGEAPVVCDDLVQLLSDMKAKVYLALQSLEKDLYSMSLLYRLPRVLIDGLKVASLHALIVQFTLNDEYKEDLSMNNSCFFVSLPDCPKHGYFINKGTEKSGALVSKIPFTHPKCVPAIIEILRHQVTYNTLIGSCVSENTTNEVVADVLSSRQIRCSLHTNPQDVSLNCCNDFITRVMERCMSVPLVMRAIFKNAVTMKVDGEIQNMDVISEQNPEVTCKQTASSNSTGANLSGASMQNSGMEASSSTASTECAICDISV